MRQAVANGATSDLRSLFELMKHESKNRYRMFKKRTKNGVFFVQDNQSGKQSSLRTGDKIAATRLLNAMNEAHRQPHLNLQIARSYLLAADPTLVTRTWQDVMDRIVSLKNTSTQDRWERAIRDCAFDSIRDLKVVETNDRHFFKVLDTGKTSTNVYLRRIHNFALGMDWLLKPVIPRRVWPKVVYGQKRGITLDEHQRIIAREGNPERRDFYELCWHLAGSQSDIADLHAEDVDWGDSTVGYNRHKLDNQPRSRIKPAIIHFGEDVAAILRRRPATGPLFPYLRTVRAGDRATEFKQRCKGLGIHGVSLHCYRYAWAERARQCGFPMRFAQEALGHNSKAVHHAYAGKAEVKVPSLDMWEKQMREKIVEMKFDGAVTTNQPSTNKEGDAPAAPLVIVRP
jgi:integrase